MVVDYPDGFTVHHGSSRPEVVARGVTAQQAMDARQTTEGEIAHNSPARKRLTLAGSVTHYAVRLKWLDRVGQRT